MQTVTTIAQTMLRFCGLMQIALGLLHWTGRARGLAAVQMLLGVVLALTLWLLALLAIRAGSSIALGLAALIWGVVVAALGLALMRPVANQGHGLVTLAHLLATLGAIALGNALAARPEQDWPNASPTQGRERQEPEEITQWDDSRHST